MEFSTDETNSLSKSEESSDEMPIAWQDSQMLNRQEYDEDDDVQKKIEEVTEKWLSFHGKSLFALEVSKYLRQKEKSNRSNKQFEEITGYTVDGNRIATIKKVVEHSKKRKALNIV